MTPQEDEGITLQIDLKKICPKIPNPEILYAFELLLGDGERSTE
jgi:hypothetical protein